MGFSDESRLKRFFERYANDAKDNLPGRIGPNGVVRLLKDLRLGDDDRRVLILACKLKAQVQCEFSWDEWRDGLMGLGVDNVDGLRNKLDSIDRSLAESAQFEEVYQFSFIYGRGPGQRNLELDTARAYWNILFKKDFPVLSLWDEYMEKVHKKAVTRDAWNRLLDFALAIKPDLSNYDEEQAWPVVFDEFVEWAKSRG